jgi:acetyltransferase
MSSVTQLKPFLEPRSIAVVGANPNSGEQAFNVVENLAQCGYQGKVYPVNPNYKEILGKKCYATVKEIPGDVDLAIIVTPRAIVSGIVKQCGEKGIKAAIVVGQGFSDAADEEGKRLQQELVEVARKSRVRILGPNTVGSANAFINFSAAFLKQTDIRKLPVGIVCQSGLFFGTVGRLRLLGKGLDLGNSCDIDVSEAMEYFAEDPQVKVIVLHIEGIRDGKRFREVAQRVVKKKPVIALKTGRTERSARAAQSHTGSLVGKDEVWDAVFKQCGIIRSDNIDELGDLVRTFSYLPTMAGRGIGVVTASGGIGIMTLDACAKYNLEVVELSPEVKQRLTAMSPVWYKAGNPLDIWPAIMTSPRPFGETLKIVMTEVLRDPRVNAIVLFAGAWFQGFKPLITDVIKETADAFPDKPIAWCPYDGWLFNIRSRDLADKLEEAGRAAVFSIPEDAVRALSRLAEYSEFRIRSS